MSNSTTLTQATTQLHTQPFSKLLNAEVAELGDDKVALRVPITEQVLQQHGFVHGGWFLMRRTMR